MINTAKLKGRIVECGYNMESFADKMNMSRTTLRKRLDGDRDFTVSEIEKARNYLCISKADICDYFFVDDVPKMETV